MKCDKANAIRKSNLRNNEYKSNIIDVQKSSKSNRKQQLRLAARGSGSKKYA